MNILEIHLEIWTHTMLISVNSYFLLKTVRKELFPLVSCKSSICGCELYLDDKVHESAVVITGDRRVRTDNQLSVDSRRQIDVLACNTDSWIKNLKPWIAKQNFAANKNLRKLSPTGSPRIWSLDGRANLNLLVS